MENGNDLRSPSTVTLTLLGALTASAVAVIIQTAHDSLTVSLGFSVIATVVAWLLIPMLKGVFLSARITGVDVLKKDRKVIPETMGLIAALVYLIALFIFIPFPFVAWWHSGDPHVQHRSMENLDGIFPWWRLGEILSALLSLQSMVLLGFADDVFDIRWRYKLPLPIIASIPLLMVYYVNFGATDIVVPKGLRSIFGNVVDLGPLYYVYMMLLSVFCTNSINILAGINGIEAGQSLIIAITVAINDSLFLSSDDPRTVEAHRFSLYFMLPFIGVTFALLWHNWFPARVFVGDTYCYFAGMTFAVVGILGHFSKTLLLFFLPQIFNFIYSAPQLFGLVPCPRHRMPKLDADTGKLVASFAPLQARTENGRDTSERLDKVKPLGKVVLNIYEALGLVKINRGQNGKPLSCNNFTLINLILVRFGSMREDKVTLYIMIIQMIGSFIGWGVRYGLAGLVYELKDGKYI